MDISEMIQHLYIKRRSRFTYPIDEYEHWVIIAPEEGSFNYKINDMQGNASFGDLLICPPGVPLEREVTERLSFHFIMFDANETVEENKLSAKVSFTDIKRLASTYSYLRLLVNQVEWDHHAMKHKLIMDIFNTLSLQQLSNHELINSPDPLMNHAAEYMQQHAHSQLSMKALSDELGLSPVQFSRKFKKSFGHAPSEYLTSIRLQKSQSLLAETDYTIQEIAERCGYDDGLYFSRVFSQKMKMSPSSFRRTHRI